LSRGERGIIAGVLGLVALLAGFDLFTDSREGVEIWHVLVEASIALIALVGVFFILRGMAELRVQLDQEKRNFADFKREADLWRGESRKYLEGLSAEIDRQLTKWGLTVAEKEVAFLLLKGLSLKEVAEVRSTTERTARVQSMAIYSKAGISGRSELSAFFLEDLLLPGGRSGG